ncbi:MAG: tetratricopeptide repeat protein [Phycisphaerae bacterium]|nr:tetratricopeptide repeat protein [Phycisphaerae bacterium]
MPLAKTGLSKVELELWNSPEFKKRFAESYIAETEIEPKISTDDYEDLQEIVEFISSDELDKAVVQIKKLRNPASTAVYDFMLANIYFQQEKLDESAEVYKAAIEKFSKYRRAWKNLGLIHIRNSDFEKAIPALTRVIELGGHDAITYGLLGYAYTSVENNLSAESAYRFAIMLDPKTLDWKMGLARSFFKQEKFADAVNLCGQLIKKNPERSDLWLLQANAYIGLSKAAKAAEIYELLDNLGKSTADTLNMLGDIYINEELYHMAVKSYIRAMDKKPDFRIDRPLRAAKVLVARGASEATRKLIEHIEELKKDKLDKSKLTELLKIKARLAVSEGAGEEEVRVLEEIVALDPFDGEALILLGQHSSRNGDPEKAVNYFERAQAIEKFEADALVRHAQLLVGQTNYKEAARLLKRAQQIKFRENIQKYLEQVEKAAKKA